MEIRPCVKWSLTGGLKTKIVMPSPQKVVAVTYLRWSFTRGSNYWDITWENLVFWIGDRLQEVVAHGVQNSLIATTMIMVVYGRVNDDNS